MLPLLIVGSAFVLFAAGVFAGSVWEQMCLRMGLRHAELHLAVRKYLDADAVVAGKRPSLPEWKAYSAAHHRLADLVGWERPAPSSSGVHVRAGSSARQERPAC